VTDLETTVAVRFRTARRRPQPPKAAPVPRLNMPIARRIALAHRIEAMVQRGAFDGYADAARRMGLTPARVTQIVDLVLLAPDIQAAVLLGLVEPRDRHLRAVGKSALWTDQRATFRSLFPNVLLEDLTDDHDRNRHDLDRHLGR
jgi:hypothetical protein